MLTRSTQRLAAHRARWLLAALVVIAASGSALGACGTTDTDLGETDPGEQLFQQAFPSTNGRSCASCHVPEDNFALTPAHVAKLLETNPSDPLFAAIDADDPTAATLTYEHLKKGLVRVWLTLPDNVDLIDAEGA